MKTAKAGVSGDKTRRKSETMTSRKILASALGSFKIEGLELDIRSASEFRDLENGSVSASELRRRLLSRYSKSTVTK